MRVMAESQQANDKLAGINSAVLGTTMPQVTLGDGRKVATGTIAALIVNIKAYDEIMRSGAVAEGMIEEARKTQLEANMAASLPVLKMSGRCGENHQ
jgi:hypothetical protein